MSFGSNEDDVFDRMTRLLDGARAPSEALVGEVAAACCRGPLAAAKANRVGEFVKVGAWLDATAALIAHELPQWTLQGLLFEDGEWQCSLGREPNLAVGFGEAAHGRHAVLALAVLSAFVDGCRRREEATEVVSASGPWPGEAAAVVCCDDFA